jgi:Zn-dependent protease
MAIYNFYLSFGPSGAAAYLLWMVGAIVLHELAHGWAAIWQGDDTPRVYQRMTWNPMVHMGLYSLIMLVLVGIAWGMMPTDPSKYRWGRRGRIVVSGAGPAMNALLWLICWVGLGLVFRHGIPEDASSATGLYGLIEALPTPGLRGLAIFLLVGGYLNGLLTLFNLLPIPPFDGASILAGFSRRFYVWMHDPRVHQWGFLFVMVAMFSGISAIMSRFAMQQGLRIVDLVAGM